MADKPIDLFVGVLVQRSGMMDKEDMEEAQENGKPDAEDKEEAKEKKKPKK